MITYLLGATLTFVVLFGAFLCDRSTPKTDLYSWFVLLVGAALWFITVPLMIRKRLMAMTHPISSAAMH